MNKEEMNKKWKKKKWIRNEKKKKWIRNEKGRNESEMKKEEMNKK